MIVFVKIRPKRWYSIQSVPRDAGFRLFWMRSVPEIIDPVFAKTSQYARFLLSENERFGLVFVKTGSINSGTGLDSKESITLFSVAWRAGTITLSQIGS